ncbi:MAG TPA: dTDP-4-dehydrorhamnose 3,5-epimerase family protein [bacterium]|nr:dTDP-4-dehydrorhamnose 3,5-epimerase family protein [bacterium]
MELFNGLIIKKLEKYHDDRGWLCEVYREDEIKNIISKNENSQFDTYKPVMTYVSVTNPGIVRGPHEHKFQSDCFVFTGPGNFSLCLWDNRKDSETYGIYIEMKVGEINPMCVIVPPGIVHGYKCISDVPAWSINLPDKLYKGPGKTEEVDEIRWEQVENSPFKIN